MNRAMAATYQKNHPEVHSIAKAFYQINPTENHKGQQTIRA
jgi:hypothetical protein